MGDAAEICRIGRGLRVSILRGGGELFIADNQSRVHIFVMVARETLGEGQLLNLSILHFQSKILTVNEPNTQEASRQVRLVNRFLRSSYA